MEPIDVRHEPDFQLGGIAVSPRTCEILYHRTVLKLEPRVMQVLVALARAPGAVVSRDELIDLCWEGRIVGEAAINRVIVQLRRAMSNLAEPQLAIETITKVGYRLVFDGANARGPTDGPLAPVPSAGAGWSRRAVAIGAAGLAGAGALGVAALVLRGPDADLPAEAKQLYDKALEADRQGLREQSEQGIVYLEQAVERAPRSPRLRGALALSLAQKMEDVPDPALGETAARAQAAARRALALDAGNVDAAAALALLPTTYGRWAQAEQAALALVARDPGHVAAWLMLASLLCDTGRWQAALAAVRRVQSLDPYVPVAHEMALIASWSVGRIVEADIAIDKAYRLWPKHQWTWLARFNFFVLSGRADAALAFAEQIEARPDARDLPIGFQTALMVARALQSGERAQKARTVSALVDAARERKVGTFPTAGYLSMLGAPDACLALVRRAFFGGSFDGEPPAPPPPPLGRRHTRYIFLPSFASARRETAFRALIDQMGLVHYWALTGTHPDVVIT